MIFSEEFKAYLQQREAEAQALTDATTDEQINDLYKAAELLKTYCESRSYHCAHCPLRQIGLDDHCGFGSPSRWVMEALKRR